MDGVSQRCAAKEGWTRAACPGPRRGDRQAGADVGSWWEGEGPPGLGGRRMGKARRPEKTGDVGLIVGGRLGASGGGWGPTGDRRRGTERNADGANATVRAFAGLGVLRWRMLEPGLRACQED